MIVTCIRRAVVVLYHEPRQLVSAQLHIFIAAGTLAGIAILLNRPVELRWI
jgi:hypothetical protein